MPLTPGEVAKCSRCGTQAIAYSSSPDRWRPGDAVMLAWHGYRFEATTGTPALCLPCASGEALEPPPNRRSAIVRALAMRGVRSSGFEWNTDDEIEGTFQRWISRGSPPLGVVEVHPLDGSEFIQAARDYLGASGADGFVAVRATLETMDGAIVRPVVAVVPKRSTKPPPAQGSLF